MYPSYTMASAMEIESPNPPTTANTSWKTASGLSLSPPLRISTRVIVDQEERMKTMNVSDLGAFPRFRYERHAEANTQPMRDDELDMDLAKPVSPSWEGEGRDAHCFKSFWDCCRGART